MENPVHGKKVSTVLISVLVIGLGFGMISFLGGSSEDTATDVSSQQMTPEMIEAEKRLEARKQARLAEEQKAWKASPAGEICLAHPSWEKDICEVIAAKKVRIGMDQEQARASWGVPDDINRTTTAGGRREQWVYGYSSYLYFENGILTSIQN